MKYARQSGAVLLTVSLLLAMTAAMAFMLNREGLMATQSVAAQYDAKAARYLAEAAVARARWMNQTPRCGNAGFTLASFANGTIAAVVAKAASKTLNIVATGKTSTGAQFVITRTKSIVRNLGSTSAATLNAGAIDTYVVSGSPTTNYDTAATLELSSNASTQSNILMSWDATEVTADSVVVTAVLTLTKTDGVTVARPVSLHRVLTAWDANTTWNNAKGATPWTTPGGSYTPAVATATVTSAVNKVTWDVTALVDGWVQSKPSNLGLLLRLANPGQTATFASSKDATATKHPALRVTYSKPC